MFRLFKKIQQVYLLQYSRDIESIKFFSNSEKQEIEKLMKRVFNTEDGQKILAYLNFLSTYKTYNYNAPEQQLYFTEGQRTFVANIQKIITQK